MAPRKPWSFKGLLSVGHWPVVHWPMALVLSPSALLCPAPMLVRLPVGRVQAFCLGVRPAHSRGSQSLFVVPVEHQHDPVIFFHVRRHWRPINEKPHGRVVRIVILRREQDGLPRRFRLAPRSVGKKTVVPVRPKMGVKCLNALL